MFNKESHKQSLLNDPYISPEIIYKVLFFAYINYYFFIRKYLKIRLKWIVGSLGVCFMNYFSEFLHLLILRLL